MNSNATEQELVLCLERLKARKEFLLSQKTEVLKRLQDISREESRLQRNLDYMIKSDRAAC